MALTVPLSNRTGVLQSPAAAVPDTSTSGSIVITGASVSDPTVRLSTLIDFSPDGGVTWASTSPGPQMAQFPAVATYAGGSILKNGPQTQFDIAENFPPGTNRKVRGTFTFDGNPFTGQAVLNWS